jgi:hypothetical protein
MRNRLERPTPHRQISASDGWDFMSETFWAMLTVS